MKALLKALVIIPFFSHAFPISSTNRTSMSMEAEQAYNTDHTTCWEVIIPCEKENRGGSVEECQAIVNQYGPIFPFAAFLPFTAFLPFAAFVPFAGVCLLTLSVCQRESHSHQLLQFVSCLSVVCDKPLNKRVCFLSALGFVSRFNVNAFHQLGEYIYPMLDRIISEGKAPGHVWWRFTLMPLSLELLQIAMPETIFSHGIWSPELEGCKNAESRVIYIRRYTEKGFSLVWPKTGHLAADILRHKVYKYCNITSLPGVPDFTSNGYVTSNNNIGATNQSLSNSVFPKLLLLQIAILERENVVHTTKCNMPDKKPMVKERRLDTFMYKSFDQNFKRLLEDEIHNRAEHVKLSFGKMEVRHIPKNPGSLCEQARRFAGAHILVSVHGAHLSLANFMSPKSVLVEVLPWACHELTHIRRIVEPIGIGYAKMCGARPVSSQVRIPDLEVCSKNMGCREMIRDCFPVTVGGRGCRGCLCAGRGIVDSLAIMRQFYSPNITG